jgi:localization factor PodJL
MAAVALSPTAAGPLAAPTPNSAQSEAGAEIYADGVRRVEAHDNTGVDSVRRAANLGYAPAEFYLAKLYEGGGAGLKKDIGQARAWTERAAEAGDQKAMHNMALYYFEGTGGPKNLSLAADWFHRAADLGLVDSQYNLARLYEEGFGVSQNPAEAYKWYLIAARSGDAESRSAAQRLKSQLSPEAQAAAERAVQGFQTQGPALGSTQLAQATVTAGGSADITTAQRGLSRLGYYQGPYDGVSSPALNLAIAAYQRDQGLPATGTLDSTVTERLAAAGQ